MATLSNKNCKFKIDFIEPTTGEKFSEEPFYSNINVLESIGGGGVQMQDYIDDVNDNLNALISLTGASCTAKHIIYDLSIAD